MPGVGHSWEAVSFLTLGASVRGSRAYLESGGASLGSSTSTNSPDQTVVGVGGEGSGVLVRSVLLCLVLQDTEIRSCRWNRRQG